MIRLVVAEYCHKCPEFEPSVDKLFACNEMVQATVMCKRHMVCENIYEFVLKMKRDEEKQ